MNLENLELAIKNAAEKANVPVEEIEKNLDLFLNKKYLVPDQLEDKLIKTGKQKIIYTLYSCQGQRMWNGYCGWYVTCYRDLLWQFGRLSPAEQIHFDRIIEDLIKDEIIDLCDYSEKGEPREVGLTKKGILLIAENDLT